MVPCAGRVGVIVYSPARQPAVPTMVEVRSPGAPVDASLNSRILEVASNFRCACEGCNELPLDECSCEIPRGAKEEKDFIRAQLENGLSVDQVIAMVEAEYGLRNL